MIKCMIGDKFYNFNEDDSINMIRLVRMKNSNCFIFKDNKGEELKLNEDQLKEYYKLRPDGYLSYNIVQLEGGMKDIIVTLHRRKDVENGDQVPHCVCRQNIYDLFTNQTNRNPHMMYIGVSMSKDTCPEDVDYNMMVACNGIVDMITIGVYMDDTLDDLLSFIKTEKYDEVLASMYKDVVNMTIHGYTDNLRQLLTENNFMYDFLKAFDIEMIDFKIEYDKETNVLDPEQVLLIEDIIKHEMLATCVIPFSKDIELDKIQKKCIMVSDKENKVYIIAYIVGNPINRAIEQGKVSKRDLLTMLKHKKRTSK